MGPARTILFLCPHNAAKSVLAAAYFDTMALNGPRLSGPLLPAPSPDERRRQPSSQRSGTTASTLPATGHGV